LKPQPWKYSDATELIREMGKSKNLSLSFTDHCKQRLRERDLTISDVWYVLKNGFVFNEPETATQNGFYKYQIESRTPNSNNRTVRLVIIPDYQDKCWIKLVTIMWADE
jgi:Domain of unknown function (DUF4258)